MTYRLFLSFYYVFFISYGLNALPEQELSEFSLKAAEAKKVLCSPQQEMTSGTATNLLSEILFSRITQLSLIHQT